MKVALLLPFLFLFAGPAPGMDVNYEQRIDDSKATNNNAASEEFVKALESGTGAGLVEEVKSKCETILKQGNDEASGTLKDFDTCVGDAFANANNLSTADMLKAAEAFGFIVETKDNAGQVGYVSKGGEPLEGTKLYYKIVQQLSEEFKKGLYGANYRNDFREGKLKIVGHQNFFTLYQNQLAKNLLMETSAFCLENYTVKLASKNKDAKLTSANKTNDETIYREVMDTIANQKTAAGDNQGGAHYMDCVTNVKYFCYCNHTAGSADLTKLGNTCVKKGDPDKGVADKTMHQGELLALLAPALTGTDAKDMLTELKKASCPLVNRLEEYSLLVDDLKKKSDAMKASMNDGAGQGFKTQPGQLYDAAGGNGSKKISDMGTITSKTMKDLSADITKDNAKAMEECANTKDMATCEKIIKIGDGKTLNDLLLEAKVKSELIQNMIANSEDKDQLKQVVMAFDQKTADEIDKMITAAVDLDEIKGRFQKKYELEAQSIHDNIKEKMKLLEVRKKDFAGGGGAGPANLGNVKVEIENESDRLEKLIQYNNLVSSFVSLSDNTGQSTGNFGTLAREELPAAEEFAKSKGDPTYADLFQNVQQEIGKNLANASTDDGGGFNPESFLNTVLQQDSN